MSNEYELLLPSEPIVFSNLSYQGLCNMRLRSSGLNLGCMSLKEPIISRAREDTCLATTYPTSRALTEGNRRINFVPIPSSVFNFISKYDAFPTAHFTLNHPLILRRACKFLKFLPTQKHSRPGIFIMQNRFWVAGAGVTYAKGGDEYTGDVVDWDQRRWISVKGSTEFLIPDDDVELEVLKRHINQLPKTVHSITVDNEGLLVSVSSDPEDDATLVPRYPRLSNIPSLQGCPTINLSKLQELARIAPKVDFVSYVDECGKERKAIFKYSIVFQLIRQVWNELHLTKSLPRHPNLIQFDRIVLDDTEARIIGFTTKFVPGGDLDQNRSRVFRLDWLKQLTAVLDFLNLELGIMHQDVATRNLLIDPETDSLILFDFDRAARIGLPGCDPDRDDVKGVIFTLYELITCDYHFREVPYDEQDAESVQNLEEWPVSGKLDVDVGLFREHLNEWVRSRKVLQETSRDEQFKLVPIEIPAIPPPSPCIVGQDENGEPIVSADRVQKRADVLKFKGQVIVWDRSPSKMVWPSLDTIQGSEC